MKELISFKNGLSAQLDSFRFYVCDFDWNDWGVDLNAVYAGLNTSASAVNYTSSVEYNADSTEFSVLFDGPAFAGQGNSNDNNDEIFDEDELLRIQVCFTLNDCPDFQGESKIPIRYKATWGCGDEICNEQHNAATRNAEICYEIELRNTAPTTYNSFVQLDILDDLQSNAIVDAIDPVLGTFTHTAVSIPTDGTVIITGCIEVQEDLACPVLLNQTFDSMCECEHTSLVISDLPPQVIAENDVLVTCPSEPMSFELCGNYTYSFSDLDAVTVIERY